MSEFRITTRYAKALLDLGEEKSQLDALYNDVAAFVEVCENSRELIVLFKNPIVLTSKKKAIVHRLFDGKMGDIFLSFIDVMVRKNRSSYIFETAERFLEIYKAKNKVSGATLYTAVEAAESLKQEVSAMLEKATGDKIELNTVVDSNLIGGFKVRHEDRLLDASVASKLRKLEQELID